MPDSVRSVAPAGVEPGGDQRCGGFGGQRVERLHAGAGESAQPGASAEAPAAAAAESNSADASPRHEPANAPAKMQSRLGTGHGRNEASRVSVVDFERAGDTPAETIAIQYDRRENLVAMGVLPGPRFTRREPDPFPGAMRFAPDPDR